MTNPVVIDADDVLSLLGALGEATQDLPLSEIAEMMVDNVHGHDIPIRTGALYESIESQIVGNEISVNSPLDYAVFVDQGTRYQEAQPFMYLDDWLESDIEDLICKHLGLEE
jgi:hypothetical protein